MGIIQPPSSLPLNPPYTRLQEEKSLERRQRFFSLRGKHAIHEHIKATGRYFNCRPVMSALWEVSGLPPLVAAVVAIMALR